VRLSPDIRGTFTKFVKKGLAVTRIAELFDTTRQTVHRWLKRAKHVGREYYKDRPRKPKESKVTMEVELSILKMRTTFKWGTSRIQQGLFNLPAFIRDSVGCVQGVRLSRETINNVLARNNQNGYQVSLSAGNSLGPVSLMSFGKSTSRVRFRCRVRSTGLWCALMITAAFWWWHSSLVMTQRLGMFMIFWSGKLGNQGRYCRIMVNSLGKTGKTGVASTMLSRCMRILLTLRTRVRLSGAFRT
jgi:hypothetical protein